MNLLAGLPDTAGVYLFYGLFDHLLYIGKSKSIRQRVRAHFTAPEERAMCAQVERVEARTTAGELGALLLESRLIKELRPFYNVRARHRRRLIVARRVMTPKGYLRVSLEAVSRIDASSYTGIMGIFKTKTQAQEYLAKTAKEERLCPKLLGLEHSHRACFAYHLKQCDGACIGLEDARSYNARVEGAFEERRIKAWPFPGAILIEERSQADDRMDVFIVKDWCLLYSFTVSEGRRELNVRGPHSFDLDSYRILAGYVLDERNAAHIRMVGAREIKQLRVDAA